MAKYKSICVRNGFIGTCWRSPPECLALLCAKLGLKDLVQKKTKKQASLADCLFLWALRGQSWLVGSHGKQPNIKRWKRALGKLTDNIWSGLLRVTGARRSFRARQECRSFQTRNARTRKHSHQFRDLAYNYALSLWCHGLAARDKSCSNQQIRSSDWLLHGCWMAF